MTPAAAMPLIASREFEKTMVAAKVHTDRQMLAGMQHAELTQYTEFMFDQLVTQLTTMVLTEPAGHAARDYVKAALPIRPRWLPKFLWQRIPTRDVKWTLTARPRWSYPHCSVAFDKKMGSAVRMIAQDSVDVHGKPEWKL